MTTFDGGSHVDAIKTDYRFTTTSINLQSISVNDMNLRAITYRSLLPSVNGILAVIHNVQVNLDSIVARASTHNVGNDAGNVSGAASNVEKGHARIRLKLKGFQGRTVNVRSRKVNVSFLERLVCMCHIFVAPRNKESTIYIAKAPFETRGGDDTETS
jgi:hypothetical protein